MAQKNIEMPLMHMGLCKYHRKSFNIMSKQFSLFEEDSVSETVIEESSVLVAPN
jgi:hypothetical protein